MEEQEGHSEPYTGISVPPLGVGFKAHQKGAKLARGHPVSLGTKQQVLIERERGREGRIGGEVVGEGTQCCPHKRQLSGIFVWPKAGWARGGGAPKLGRWGDSLVVGR